MQGCLRIVAGNGEANHRLVTKGDGLLYEALAERAAPDDGASVVVLDGTSENLGCRCRCLVDEDDEGYVLVAAATIATILLTGRLTALGIDDEAVLGQELVGNLYGRLQVTACIAAQVDAEALEAFLRQLGQMPKMLYALGDYHVIHVGLPPVSFFRTRT